MWMRQKEQGKSGRNKVRRQILQQGAWIFCSTHIVSMLRQSLWSMCGKWIRKNVKKSKELSSSPRREKNICVHDGELELPTCQCCLWPHILASGHIGRKGRQREVDLQQTTSGGLNQKKVGKTAKEITNILSGRKKAEF